MLALTGAVLYGARRIPVMAGIARVFNGLALSILTLPRFGFVALTFATVQLEARTQRGQERVVEPPNGRSIQESGRSG